MEIEGSWGSFTNQPSPLGEFQSDEKPCLKNNVIAPDGRCHPVACMCTHEKHLKKNHTLPRSLLQLFSCSPKSELVSSQAGSPLLSILWGAPLPCSSLGADSACSLQPPKTHHDSGRPMLGKERIWSLLYRLWSSSSDSAGLGGSTVHGKWPRPLG